MHVTEDEGASDDLPHHRLGRPFPSSVLPRPRSVRLDVGGEHSPLFDTASPDPPIPTWVPDEVVGPATEALHRIGAEQGGTVGITSTLRGEGRTTIAMACAIGAAYDFGLRTILVDL